MCASQKRLPVSRSPHLKNDFGYAPAEFLKFLRLLQKFNYLLKLFFGLFYSGNVFERDALLLVIEKLGARFSETQSLVAARLHLAQHENPDDYDEEYRCPTEYHRPDETAASFILDLRDARIAVNYLARQHIEITLDEFVGERYAILLPAIVNGGRFLLLKSKLLYVAAAHLVFERGLVNLLNALALSAAKDLVEQ